MKILLCFCFLFFINILSSQVKIASNNTDGTLSILNLNDCKEETYSLNQTFSDIAFTPNNNLYGIINGLLFKIDYLNSSYSVVGSAPYGTGLVALDDNFLLIDSNDSLYKISTTTANSVPLGKIGYVCVGDFAILNDTVYMTDWNYHLIKIILNASKTSILSVKDVGFVKTNNNFIYSLFTAYPSCTASSKELFGIVKNNIYKINPQTTAVNLVCTIPNPSIDSYGATSSFEFDTHVNLLEQMPNVFTPNGDNINDLLSFTKCDKILKTTIYNRWGNEIFSTENQNHFWDGRTNGGEACAEGTYYYVILTEEKTVKGYIQLVR